MPRLLHHDSYVTNIGQHATGNNQDSKKKKKVMNIKKKIKAWQEGLLSQVCGPIPQTRQEKCVHLNTHTEQQVM